MKFPVAAQIIKNPEKYTDVPAENMKNKAART